MSLDEPAEPPIEDKRKHGVVVPDRIPELDGIRGIAALVVVFHHLSQSFPALPGVPRLLAIWLAATHAGWLGVDIFFALSGFLITRTLIETRERPRYYRNFYMRRVLRLMPPYLLTLLLVAIFVPGSAKFLLLSLVYLANFSESFGIPMVYGPLWSLAVEEHFYLLWPWLVRFLRLRTVLLVALGVCVLSPPFRLLAQRHGFFNPYASWFRFDGLLWGAMLATLIAAPRATRKTVALWSAIVGGIGTIGFAVGALFGAMARQSVVGSSVVFGLVAMATSGVIGFAALGTLPKAFSILKSSVLRFLGDISYWLYLIHALIIELFVRWVPICRLGAVGFYLLFSTSVLAISVLSGVVVRRWIELPALSLKRRFR